MNAELAHGAEHEPPALRVLSCSVGADVVDDTKALPRRAEEAGLRATVARLGNGTHGGDGESRGWRHGEHEALEGGARDASSGGEVHVYVGDEGGGGVCEEQERDDAAEGD